MSMGHHEQTFWRKIVAILSVAVVAVAGLNVYKYWPTSTSSTANGVGDAADEQNVTLNTRPPLARPDVEGPDSPQTLTISLANNKLAVSGTAPSTEVAVQMATFTTSLYAEAASADFTVGAAETPAWLAAYPEVVRQLGVFNEASLEVTKEATTLTGRVPNERDRDRIERTLSGEQGFPPLESSVEVAELRTAELDVLVTQSQVNVGGTVPSQADKDRIIQAIDTAYGRSINDTITINANVASQLNLVRFADDIADLSSFQNQRISFELGQTYSFITRELTFDPGQSDLTTESASALEGLPDFLNRTGLDVRIIGHTDDVGDQQVNTLLSIERAKSVANVFVAANVDSEQIIVIGRGERGASGQATDEERSADRSVDIQIGTVIY